VPATLAARVFEVQEQLDELRTAPEDQELRRSIEALGRQIRAEIAGYGERLDSQFRRFRESADRSAGLLAELKQILSERAYLNTLLRDVEKELEDPWNGSSAST
jgi:hypothetical protein